MASLRPLAGVVLILSIAACGQTGDLHHPQSAPSKENYLLKKRPAKPVTPTSAPAAPTPSAPATDPVPSETTSPDSPAPQSPSPQQ